MSEENTVGMRVLQISSEATPFAKTGGLADVAGALPESLGRGGCDCTLVVPAYREVFEKNLPIKIMPKPSII